MAGSNVDERTLNYITNVICEVIKLSSKVKQYFDFDIHINAINR